jgi:hypothetical protein
VFRLNPRVAFVAVAVPVATATLLAVTVGQAGAATRLSHSQATAKLRAANIGWTSSGGCSNRANSHCTSFTQIRGATISGVITFKRASHCGITITGGTEVGHASGTYSHYNGYKVDVARTTCVTNYIHRTYGYIGLRGDGARMYRSGAGNIYADEGSHWDVLYYNCGGC